MIFQSRTVPSGETLHLGRKAYSWFLPVSSRKRSKAAVERVVRDGKVASSQSCLRWLARANALRPSELFALRWRCFDPKHSTLTLGETVYKGNIRNWGKTSKSLSAIHLAPGLVIQPNIEDCVKLVLESVSVS